MIKMTITLKRRSGMTHDEFTAYQRDVHRPLFLSIPETRRYVRRFIVSYPIAAPRYGEPSYDSVVEAWFDTMDDLNALYFSDNFLNVVDPDHPNFIDMASVGRMIGEDVVVVG